MAYEPKDTLTYFTDRLATLTTGRRYAYSKEILNVRESPYVGAKVIGHLSPMEKVTIVDQHNGWYFIEEKQGWSSGAYLTIYSTREK